MELAGQISTADHDGPFWSFVLANLRLVVHWARKSARVLDGTLLEVGDLIHAGTEGLVNAVERFDASRGFKFSTYGSWWIRQAMSREVPPMARAFYLPTHMWDQIETLRRELEQDSSDAQLDEAGIAQVADQLQMDVDKVRLLLRLSQESVSLQDLLIEQEAIDRAIDLIDDEDVAWRMPLLEGEEVIPRWRVEEALVDGGSYQWDLVEPWEFETVIDQILIESLFSESTPWSRDQAILEMRYGLGGVEGERTLEEIGERFNLTRERVRRIAAARLAELREMIGPLDDW